MPPRRVSLRPVEHGPEELAREGRIVRSATRASLMSDTKWRKLFTAFDIPDLRVGQVVFKFLGSADEVRCAPPRRPALYPPRPWFDIAAFGPTPFRSIEWLLIPRVAVWSREGLGAPLLKTEQEVEIAVRIVESLGRYPTEISDQGLRIIGYLT